MGDAADDVYAAWEADCETLVTMTASQCKPCSNRDNHGENECPVCLDLLWVDQNGNPCEP